MASDALFARGAANLNEEFEAGTSGSEDDTGSSDSGEEEHGECSEARSVRHCAPENARRSGRVQDQKAAQAAADAARDASLADYAVGRRVEVRKNGKGTFWEAKVVQRRTKKDAAGNRLEEAKMKYVDGNGNMTDDAPLWLTIGDLEKLRPPQPSKEEKAAAKAERKRQKEEERTTQKLEKEAAKRKKKQEREQAKKERKKRKRDAEKQQAENETATRLASNELELSRADTPQTAPAPRRRGKADTSLPSEAVQACKNGEKLGLKLLDAVAEADRRSNVAGRRAGQKKGLTFALAIIQQDDKENVQRVGRAGRSAKTPTTATEPGQFQSVVTYLSGESNLTREDVANVWLGQGSVTAGGAGDESGYTRTDLTSASDLQMFKARSSNAIGHASTASKDILLGALQSQAASEFQSPPLDFSPL